MAVELRVQGGIIIHLELEISREGAPACDHVGEQVREASLEVTPLLVNAGQFLGAFFAVGHGGFGADGFFLHVKFFERQNGEAINHHAWGFRIAWAPRRGRGERGDNGFVYFFSKIVSLLIEAIDVTLRLVDAFEAEIITPRDIFFMPQRKIAQMIFLQEAVKAGPGCNGGDLMPLRGEFSLPGRYILSVEFHG